MLQPCVPLSLNPLEIWFLIEGLKHIKIFRGAHDSGSLKKDQTEIAIRCMAADSFSEVGFVFWMEVLAQWLPRLRTMRTLCLQAKCCSQLPCLQAGHCVRSLPHILGRVIFLWRLREELCRHRWLPKQQNHFQSLHSNPNPFFSTGVSFDSPGGGVSQPWGEKMDHHTYHYKNLLAILKGDRTSGWPLRLPATSGSEESRSHKDDRSSCLCPRWFHQT
jgi:hypothetical protein